MFREAKRMRKIKTEDDPVLVSIKERLYAVLSENAREIILFGSRARGDAQRDSDYDWTELAADENFNNDIIRETCFFHHEEHEDKTIPLRLCS